MSVAKRTSTHGVARRRSQPTSPVRELPGRDARAGPPPAQDRQPASYRRSPLRARPGRPRPATLQPLPIPPAAPSPAPPTAALDVVSCTARSSVAAADAAAVRGATWPVRGRAGPQGAGAAGGAAAGQSQPAITGGGDAGHRPGAAGGGGGMPERGPAGTGREPRAVGDPGTVHRPARRTASERPIGHVGPLPGEHTWSGRHHGRWCARATLCVRLPSVWTPVAAGGS